LAATTATAAGKLTASNPPLKSTRFTKARALRTTSGLGKQLFVEKTARNFPKTSSKHSTDLESELKAKRSVQAEVLARADWASQHQHIPTNQL
jgi:hypothetical protein